MSDDRVATELLRALIRDACVNDGDPASGQEVRNADAADRSVRTDPRVSGVLAPPRPTRVPPGPG